MRAGDTAGTTDGTARDGARATSRGPRPWRQEALFVGLCFAAASAVPFLPEAVQARYGPAGLDAPPLLLIAAATVLGTGAIWLLRQGRFFAAPMAGLGLMRAVHAGAMLVPVAVALDLAGAEPPRAAVPWPEAWLFHPSAAVPATAALILVPLALTHAALRRAWPAMLASAAAQPLALLATGAVGTGAAGVAVAGFSYLSALVEMTFLRRHGILAALAFRLVLVVGWQVLWGGARMAMSAGGP